MRRTALAVVVAIALSACATPPVPRTALDDEPPQMLNAFFGLDDALPPVASVLCPEGPGADGMPVGANWTPVERDSALFQTLCAS